MIEIDGNRFLPALGEVLRVVRCCGGLRLLVGYALADSQADPDTLILHDAFGEGELYGFGFYQRFREELSPEDCRLPRSGVYLKSVPRDAWMDLSREDLICAYYILRDIPDDIAADKSDD